MGLLLLLATMWHGVMAMAYSLLISSVASQIINSWPNWRLLNYRYLEQLKDILPCIAIAIGMGCCVSLVNLLHLADAVTLLIQIPLGAVIYLTASAVFRLGSFQYLKGMVRSFIER